MYISIHTYICSYMHTYIAANHGWARPVLQKLYIHTYTHTHIHVLQLTIDGRDQALVEAAVRKIAEIVHVYMHT